jgi:signal transduction histidine kinase
VLRVACCGAHHSSFVIHCSSFGLPHALFGLRQRRSAFIARITFYVSSFIFHLYLECVAVLSTQQTSQPALESLFACWQRFFATTWDADALGQSFVEEVTRLFQATRGVLLLVDENRQTLTAKGAAGFPSGAAPAPTPLGEGIVGWVADYNRPLLWHAGADIPAPIREHVIREQANALLCVPISADGRVVGVLYLSRVGQAASFTLQDLWMASMLADRLGVAMAHAQLRGQLRRQERFLNRIIESIPSSLLVIDRGMRIVAANRNFLEKARRQLRGTLGSPFTDVFPRVLIAYTGLDQKVREMFRTGQSIEGGKLSYRAPGLPTRVYYYRLIPLKVDNDVQQVLLMMDDITEREQLGAEVRRMERRMASVVECANDLVISLDPQGRIVTWNQAAERVSGRTSDQVRGRSLLSLCASHQRASMVRLLRASSAPATIVARPPYAPRRRELPALEDRAAVQHAEVNLLTADAQEICIAWSCSPMHDDAGRLIGLVVIGRDLTERHWMEAQLVQSSKMASLGVMAGGIAHELRNPLGIISSSAQLLGDYANDAELRGQCVQKIYTATRRASLIIDNLLTFARPQSKRMREVCLHTVLDEIMPMLMHQIMAQQVTFIQEVAPAPPTVYGNPELLQQVFTNLILNACNAMPNGGRLVVSIGTDADGMAEMRFQDNGCGIASEHLKKIFDPFFTTMPVGKGTGLGLSISYSIMQQHNGTIDVISQVHHGTTFILKLPCVSASERILEQPTAAFEVGGVRAG